jgi:hypothetical protein
VRIPDDADHCSAGMPIHSFRGDPDQLITIVGKAIVMPGTMIAMPRNGRETCDVVAAVHYASQKLPAQSRIGPCQISGKD